MKVHLRTVPRGWMEIVLVAFSAAADGVEHPEPCGPPVAAASALINAWLILAFASLAH
jgi:hypothetical protein